MNVIISVCSLSSSVPLTESALGAVCSFSGEKEASQTCSTLRFPAPLRKVSVFLHTWKRKQKSEA